MTRLASAALAIGLIAASLARQREATTDEPETQREVAEKLSAKKLLITLYQEGSNDRVLAISAGVTFYALLAIFPAVGAIVSIYGAERNTGPHGEAQQERRGLPAPFGRPR